MADTKIKGMGALPSPIDIRDYKATCVAKAADFPEEFELYRPPVKNQSSTSSCVAHSLSSVVEYFNHEQEGSYMKMSTAYIYGNRYGSTYVGEGMYTSQALKNLVKFGDCPDTWFTGNYEVPTAIEKFKEIAGTIPGDQTYPNRISSYFNLKTTNDIKASLMENGPVVIATTWYNGTKCVDGILQFHEETGSSGRHCMFIYGWNKFGWLVGNSWGKNWGKQGNCIIPFDHKISEVWGVSDNVLSEDKKDALIADLKIKLSEAENRHAETQEQLEENLERILELTKQVEELTKKLAEIDVNDGDLLETIEQFKKELAQAQEEMKQAKEEVVELRKIKEKYEKQIADYEAEIKTLNEKLLQYDQPFDSKLGQFIAKIINFILNLFKKKEN